MALMGLRLTITATDGAARTGTLETPRGVISLPCFMPVGTRGTVKALAATDLVDLGVEVMLANTYHLMLRPGAGVVRSLGGLHRFSGFEGHLLTDSGGYQTFSLAPVLDDNGVSFRSVYDGSIHRLTPESAVRTQAELGADIQMVLDVCSGLPARREELAAAVERTTAWARRARTVDRPGGQALFGIVQGGVDPELRVQSARQTVELDFDGYGIGGLSVGESLVEMVEALRVTLPELPVAQARYLMGVGDPVSVLEAVALGVDLFDCVAPTRLARHGSILTRSGPLSLRRAENSEDDRPLEEGCGCSVCARYSRGFLRHLLVVGEPTLARLASLHNLHFMMDLMARARLAIAAGTLGELRGEVRASFTRCPDTEPRPG